MKSINKSINNHRFNPANYYTIGKNGEELRAVAIAGKWRITKKINDREWLFLDNVEYNSFSEALEKYI